MYKEIIYTQYLDEMLKQMPKGIFMTVKTKNELNTIVLGWGNIGYLWGKKVFIVYVRYSRHTYELLQHTNEFTISVPLKNDLTDALRFCGTKSGRDFNKFEECQLTPVDGRKINTPIVGECELHYECSIIHRQEFTNIIDEQINERYYGNDNFHVAYYGEIKDCYLFEKD